MSKHENKKQDVMKSCGEDEFIDDSKFYHTIQQVHSFNCLQHDKIMYYDE